MGLVAGWESKIFSKDTLYFLSVFIFIIYLFIYLLGKGSYYAAHTCNDPPVSASPTLALQVCITMPVVLAGMACCSFIICLEVK